MSKDKNEIKRYDELAKALEALVDSGHIDHGRVYRVNFWRGVFFGLGAALGGTLVVASILYILSLFTELPVIGNLVETIRDSIDPTR
jgi:hypothetical protein